MKLQYFNVFYSIELVRFRLTKQLSSDIKIEEGIKMSANVSEEDYTLERSKDNLLDESIPYYFEKINGQNMPG